MSRHCGRQFSIGFRTVYQKNGVVYSREPVFYGQLLEVYFHFLERLMLVAKLLLYYHPRCYIFLDADKVSDSPRSHHGLAICLTHSKHGSILAVVSQGYKAVLAFFYSVVNKLQFRLISVVSL